MEFAHSANVAGHTVTTSDIALEVLGRPHRPTSLPTGRMAIYCFFLDQRALKIGKAGPNSNARYLSQHYNPGSSNSNLAKSVLLYPNFLGISPIPPASVKDWIRTRTDRINFLLPMSYGRSVLAQLENFLHTRWNPVFEGRVHPR
jgi:hypothetical protein